MITWAGTFWLSSENEVVVRIELVQKRFPAR